MQYINNSAWDSYWTVPYFVLRMYRRYLRQLQLGKHVTFSGEINNSFCGYFHHRNRLTKHHFLIVDDIRRRQTTLTQNGTDFVHLVYNNPLPCIGV